MKRSIVVYVGLFMFMISWHLDGKTLLAQVRPYESGQEPCIHAAQFK